MMVRRMLLGVACAVGVCGAVTAAPPGGPLSEGRELDPVARDFLLDEAPAPESRGPVHVAEKPRDLFGGSLFAALGEALMKGSTIQLGPLKTTDLR